MNINIIKMVPIRCFKFDQVSDTNLLNTIFCTNKVKFPLLNKII